MKHALLLVSLFVSVTALFPQKSVGVMWYQKSTMADDVTKGFAEAMKTGAPAVTIEYQKDLTKEDAKTVYARFQKEKNAVVFLRSDGATMAKELGGTKPVFLGACNNPEQLGVIKNMAAPEGFMTGVTYSIPADVHFGLYKKVFPSLKSVTLVVHSTHSGAPVDRAGTKKACTANGIAYNEIAAASLEEIVAGVKAVKSDLIILGVQNVVFDNADKIIAVTGNTPVVSYDIKAVKKGALLSLSADDVKLGKLLAQQVIDVLGGKKISEVPVKFDDDPLFTVNMAAVKKYGVVIPFQLMKRANKIGE
ncbi:MAG: hypothetical protein HZC28_16625 [Spirochaetes bacterium]|nr:hypothetical protein [Spirochaetota bacterium]